jgi:heat shock protein HslJ
MARDWEHIRSFIIKDGHLFLSLMADGGTYEFEPLEAIAQPGGPSELPATFVGTIPCADCPGIRYQVNLLPDHTFASRMTYLERKSEFDDHGSWQIADSSKTLVLQGQRARAQFALPDTVTIRMLGADGHEINSELNYDLNRSTAFAPIESPGKQGNALALEGTDWKLVSLGDEPIHSASAEQAPHLLLAADSHRVSGSGGCNRLMGSYELSGNQLTFSKLAGTMMACVSGMDTEKAFQDVLAEVRTWKMAGRVLDLFDGNGIRTVVKNSRLIQSL